MRSVTRTPRDVRREVYQGRRDDLLGRWAKIAQEERPRTRGECEEVPRPCPFVSCRQNLYLDVSPISGSLKMNFPGKEPWEVGASCALDIAEEEGVTLERVAALINVTRERVRQIIDIATRKARDADDPDATLVQLRVRP